MLTLAKGMLAVEDEAKKYIPETSRLRFSKIQIHYLNLSVSFFGLSQLTTCNVNFSKEDVSNGRYTQINISLKLVESDSGVRIYK